MDKEKKDDNALYAGELSKSDKTVPVLLIGGEHAGVIVQAPAGQERIRVATKKPGVVITQGEDIPRVDYYIRTLLMEGDNPVQFIFGVLKDDDSFTTDVLLELVTFYSAYKQRVNAIQELMGNGDKTVH